MTPSDKHLLAFGRIIHNFATCETGIKLALSGAMKIGLAEALIAFQPYGATDLKNVAKSLAKELLKPPFAEQFCQIVGDWAKYATLRNEIAHSRWKAGDKADSIKCQRVNIREGRADWIGEREEDESYTAKDLETAASQLAAMDDRIKRFLTSSGLRAIIDAKIAELSAEISALSGSETSELSK